jgi:hypothetical protein
MKVDIKRLKIEGKEFTRQEIDSSLYHAASIELSDYLIGNKQASHRDEARLLLIEAFDDHYVRKAILDKVKELYEEKSIGFVYEDDDRYKSR